MFVELDVADTERCTAAFLVGLEEFAWAVHVEETNKVEQSGVLLARGSMREGEGGLKDGHVARVDSGGGWVTLVEGDEPFLKCWEVSG